MRGRAATTLLLIVLGACARMPWMRQDDRTQGVESLYWRAVTQLDTASTVAGVSEAVSLLEGYLASGARIEHRAEAGVIRRYAITAQQLARVEASLAQRPAETETKADAPKRAEAEPRRDEEAVKEIQRLKDELAKANAELERIRKRLTNPRDPSA